MSTEQPVEAGLYPGLIPGGGEAQLLDEPNGPPAGESPGCEGGASTGAPGRREEVTTVLALMSFSLFAVLYVMAFALVVCASYQSGASALLSGAALPVSLW